MYYFTLDKFLVTICNAAWTDLKYGQTSNLTVVKIKFQQ